jgi:glutathione S-transferase
MLRRAFDVATAALACVPRWEMGKTAGGLGARPAQPLELFEFEACPACRRVREALTMLDLDAHIRPCPKGGLRFRGEAIHSGGKRLFPFLRDPNTGGEMYESADIVQYLYESYGDGNAPRFLRGRLFLPTSTLASLARADRGRRARRSRAPERELELYSFEYSPFCRLVRETLCELELPYLLHNVGKRSPRRPAFVERSGKMMVPYLVDPNTGIEMFESAAIIAYLEDTYAA